MWNCITKGDKSEHSEADDVPPSSDLQFADTESSTITLKLPTPDEDEGKSLSSDDEGTYVLVDLHFYNIIIQQ